MRRIILPCAYAKPKAKVIKSNKGWALCIEGSVNC